MLEFPYSPAPQIGETYTAPSGKSWKWNGVAWEAQLAGGSGSWADITNKPSATNPAPFHVVAFSGAYSSLSGLPALHAVATSGQYSALIGKPTLGTAASTNSSDYATATHNHAISEVTGLQAALDAAGTAGDYVSSTITGIADATRITNMIQLTQAGYNALGGNVSSSTLYIIVG
jgi:hypothetical protein